MKRHGAFNFRKACRRLNPALAAKLDRAPPLEREVQDRLDEITKQIDKLDWRGNTQLANRRLAALVDERRTLRDALGQDKAGGRP